MDIDNKVTENETIDTVNEEVYSQETTSDKATVSEKKQKNKLKLIIAAIAAFVIAIILICIFARPKVISISAKYSGDTKSGVALSEKNNGIMVTGINEKGKEVKVSGWKVESPVVLEPDEAGTITIVYKELKTKLSVECSSSVAEKITAEYSDSLKENVTVSSKNINVTATLKNGEEIDVSSDCVFTPDSITLEKDGTYEVKIEYTDPNSGDVLSTELTLVCSTMSIESISATYSGDTDAGTILDEKNNGINVTALMKDGSKKELSDWSVEKPIELKADSTATVKIMFDKYSCNLKVVCSTMSEAKYKEICKSVSYDELLRNPGKTKDKYNKITGTIFQVVSEASSEFFYSVYFIRSNGNLYRVNIDNYGSESRILENDSITVWGQVDDLYTYETLRGNANTIPTITAKYYK